MINIKQIFDLAIKMGMAADPRGPARLKNIWRGPKRIRRNQTADKAYFDTEKLTNPYDDT